MHTVERMERAVAIARKLGYRVREEWLGGSGGGVCEIAGQRWIFLDLAEDAATHLELVLETLRDDPRLASVGCADELPDSTPLRKSA